MRTSPPGLLPLFRSAMQLELAGLLLLQPDREWTLERLAANLEAPQSSVHRELQRLVSAGLVVRADDRRPHGYRAATTSPAYRPLRDLLELTIGVPRKLHEELADMPGVVAASVHGSWAAGQVRPDSDIDVLVVTNGANEDRDAIQEAIRRVGRAVGREVDASILTTEHFERLLNVRNPFLGKILNGPRIDVIGELGGATTR